jgi:hypothetical protein
MGAVKPPLRPLAIDLEEVGDQPPQDPNQHEQWGSNDRQQQRQHQPRHIHHPCHSRDLTGADVTQRKIVMATSLLLVFRC